MNDFDIQTQITDKIISDHSSIELVVGSLINAYGDAISDQTAIELREIDYLATIKLAKQWLAALLENSPPEEGISSIYFGMCDFAPNESCPHEYTQLYLDGASDFDDDGEWACDCTWTYESDLRYPILPAFFEIAKLCNGLTDLCTFTFSQAFAMCIAIELAPMIGDSLGFENHDRYPIAVGHDAGDIYILGYLTPDGLQRP